MLNDPGMGGMLNDATAVQRVRNAAYCDDDGEGYPKGFNYYKCHGHKDAYCCSNRCMNQPKAKGGRCEPCQCNGSEQLIPALIFLTANLALQNELFSPQWGMTYYAISEIEKYKKYDNCTIHSGFLI